MSFESDREILLAEHNGSSSIYTRTAQRKPIQSLDAMTSLTSLTSLPVDTPNAGPISTPAVQRSYRGYKSEEEYLAALRAWVKEKECAELGPMGLTGWYGKYTMDTYMQRPSGARSLPTAKTQPQVSTHEVERRPSQPDQTENAQQEVRATGKGSRRKSLSNWLSRS